MRRRSVMAGYGHSFDIAEIRSRQQAAYYISKYITKACDVRESVPWWGELVDVQTGEISGGLVPGRYRTWSSSRSWGMTMADARAVCREFAARRSLSREKEVVQLVSEVLGASVISMAPA